MPRGSRGTDHARRAFETARLRLARMGSSGAGSLATVFRDVTAVAADALGVERVGIWLFVDDDHAIRCFHLYERSKLAYSEGAVLYGADVPKYFRALHEQRDIAAEEARTHPLTKELADSYLEPLGIHSMLDAPIYRDGKACGVVCHEHVGPARAWSVEDRDFAATVADSIAMQLERAESDKVARRLRLEMSEVQRLRELSQVAAGVAHDFRNLLLVASWLAREISDDPATSAENADRAGKIRDTIERAQTIAAYLGTLDVGEATRPEVIELTGFVSALHPMLTTALGADHDLEIECSGDPGFVLMDKSQLERVILNLVVNARDAMRPGGTVTLVVDSTEVPDGEDPPGSYARLAIRDTGAGMDGTTRAKIFEPYFTTKERGRSSGLGLAVVHRAVDRVGGFVHVESEIGRGSTFRIYLPRVAAPRPGVAA